MEHLWSVYGEAPNGLLTDLGERPDARYWMVEDHRRCRYLHALASHNEGGGRPGTVHEVFLLSLCDHPSAS